MRTCKIVKLDNRRRGSILSRCYRGKARRTVFTRYPTVVKMLKQQLSALKSRPFLLHVAVCVCAMCGVYNRARAEIWIILSCDCPCGDPIKIRVAFRTIARDRERWRTPDTLRGLPPEFYIFFFPTESPHRTPGSRFDAPSSKFTVSPRMIRPDIFGDARGR